MNGRFLYIILLLFPIYGFAQTVKWATSPTYTSLEEYVETLYKIRQNGKVGLADISGKELLPAAYDSITHFSGGYALGLNREAGRWKVSEIINQQNYKCIQVAEKYYVSKYPFFSEGKLCVTNAKGDQGFIDTEGRVAIKCQYLEVHPFSEGYASVKLKNKRVIYINESENVMVMEPGDGIIVFGSSFHNGEAVVYTINRKSYVINQYGKALRPYGVSIEKLEVNSRDYTIYGLIPTENLGTESATLQDNGFSVFQEGGLYGYRKGDVLLLPAQLSEAAPFKGGYAKVKKNGKYGILKLVDGDSFSGKIEKSMLEVTDGKSEIGHYTLTLPSAFIDSNVAVYMETENGGNKELNSNHTNGNIRDFLFFPEIRSEEREKVLKFSVNSDGLLLWSDIQKLTFSYPVRLKLSEPVAGSEKADANDNFIIYAYIENSSSQSISLRATFYVDGKPYSDSVTIAGGNRERIQTSVKVKEKKVASVHIVLSNGIRGKVKEILLVPFY